MGLLNPKFSLLIASVVLGTTGLVLLSGCENVPASQPGDTSNAVTPGIVGRADGSVEATGVLLQIDDGAGTFWALTGQSPDPTSSRLPPVIACIVNPDTVAAEQHNGETVSILGTLDGSTPVRDWAPNITGAELRVLDSFGGLGEYRLPEPALRSIPGIYALHDGRTQVIGEVTFIDTPQGRIWALRYPATDSRQTGVHFVAAIANPDMIGLQERRGMLAINGRVTGSLAEFPGLTVITAEEIATTH